MGKFRGIDAEEGWINRRLSAIETSIKELAASRRLVVATDFAQADLNITNLTSAWANYVTQTIDVPVGYTHAIVQVSVSAGSTVSGTTAVTNAGVIGVQPVVAGVQGPALSQGKTGGGAMSINSSMSVKVAVSGTFDIWAKAYATATPSLVADSGNVHLSATVLFVRE